MPALITHHLFGENAVTSLPEGIISGQEELLAFLLGNQGPDPFFSRWRTFPTRAARCHTLAHEMHQRRATASFVALRDGVGHLVEEDKTIGRAFVLGLVAHYVLDSAAHPFVFAQQFSLCSAGVGLEDAPTEVHAVIESDIDSWLLWQERHVTVREAPAATDLVHTDRIAEVGGALFSQIAIQVYGIPIETCEYGHAVNDYRLLYKKIDPAGRLSMRVLSGAEHLARPHSQLAAMAHYPTTSDECASANLDHKPWTDPATGAERTESFADIFWDTLAVWPLIAESVVRGDKSKFVELTHGVNYDGFPEKALNA